MNTLVQEDKIKFPSRVSLFCINHEFMTFVLQSQPKTLRIRHLYDQSYSDLSSEYENSITSLKLTNSNHLVVIDQMNQVEINFLQSTTKIQVCNIKGFNKKGLVDVVVDDNVVVMITEGKLHLLQLKQNTCLSNIKQQFSESPIKGFFIHQNLYISFTNKTIRKWKKSESSQKFQEQNKIINFEQDIINFKVISNSDKNYLICQSRNKKLFLVSDDGKIIQELNFQGQLLYFTTSQRLLTIVSRLKQSQVYSLYYSEGNYDQSSSRLFFNKYQSYSRNSKYNCWQLLFISKKQWTIYSRRKGSKQIQSFRQLSDDSLCVIYGRLEADPTKIQILKIDFQKILNKDRNLGLMSSVVFQEEIKESLNNQPYFQIKNKNSTPQQPQNNFTKQPFKQKQHFSKKFQIHQSFLKSVERIIDERVIPLINRVNNIEQKINHVLDKIASQSSQAQISKIYSSIIQKQVNTMFEAKILPKMQEYFQAIFADLAVVFNQGIQYYNQKLQIETMLQKNTFKDLITHTQNATKQVIEAIKTDLPYSVHIDQLINQCVKKKDDLLQKTQELLQKVEKGTIFSSSVSSFQTEKYLKQQQKNKNQKSQDKKAKKNFIKSDL